MAAKYPGERRFMVASLLLLLLALVLACGGAVSGAPTTLGETPVATISSPALSPDAGATLPAEPASRAADNTATPDHSASTTSPIPASTSVTDSTPSIVGPLVNVGDTVFQVELALTADQQVQGLSGREVLAPGTGMLFVYERESRYTFWMKEMRFPLDMVWIGADCKVVDVTLDAPPPEPGQSLDQLPRFSPITPAQFVLEINAGVSAASGIESGDPVEFTGDLAGRFGC